MNAPILRLYVIVVVLFAVLAGFTSWWSVVGAQDLRDNALNRRELIEEQRSPRGAILAGDGSTVAGSRRGADGTYTRRYPQGALFGFPVGYSFLTLGRNGLEASYNRRLAGGTRDDVGAVFAELRGKPRRGEDLRTTLDPAAQRAAYGALGGRRGAVVAIEPRTGRVLVMASTPPFDPNALRGRRSLGRISTFNRATLGQYPPGSTMKVVTASAAIDSGRYTKDSLVNGASPKTISGAPLQNFSNEQFGDISLTDALTNSVNTVWAQVGVALGGRTMQRYMERFGFYDPVAIDLPTSSRQRSGVFKARTGLTKVSDPRVDVGRVAIGQGDLLVSPLQMAMVAAAVANDGRLMRPTLVDRFVDRAAGTSDDNEPKQLAEVMRPQTARAVGDMMARVVGEGTGTAAALEGISVAGKTGTAEKNVQTSLNQPWFIGFAPREAPKVAVAATVEESVGGTGGVVAAPVAKAVLQALLQQGSG